MSYGVQHSVPCNVFTSALRLVAASLNICYEIMPDVDGPGICPLQIISNTGQCEDGNARCIAWSHLERRSQHLNESAERQQATRAVHNRAAACVAAGDGIFETQL